ncbi:MAG: archease [Candidatus Nezhaarchaeota archaeon]|nr:archease [Candidatus Nezhaarchaeota archaeon]MCX8141891.1 archease [Candidatus Nezhaarchaeota archaeon]MDW8050328.1 archease [Nitrososphaerota archaeon]
MSIKFLEHPSDVYIEVRAKSLEEAFALCGKALYEVMTDTDTIKVLEEVEVFVEGYDLHSLLYNWLEELLYLFDVKRFLGSDVKVKEITALGEGYRLRATIVGEKYDPQRHPSKTAVKAATYHLMEIKKEGDEQIIRFVLDI